MEIVPSADLRGLHDSSAEREGLEGYDYGQLAQHAQEQFLGEQGAEDAERGDDGGGAFLLGRLVQGQGRRNHGLRFQEVCQKSFLFGQLFFRQNVLLVVLLFDLLRRRFGRRRESGSEEAEEPGVLLRLGGRRLRRRHQKGRHGFPEGQRAQTNGQCEQRDPEENEQCRVFLRKEILLRLLLRQRGRSVFSG